MGCTLHKGTVGQARDYLRQGEGTTFRLIARGMWWRLRPPSHKFQNRSGFSQTPKKSLSSVLTLCAVSLAPDSHLQGGGRRQEPPLLCQTPWGRSVMPMYRRGNSGLQNRVPNVTQKAGG